MPISGLKMVSVDQSFAGQHYQDLSTKPFFNKLVDYIISGPVVAMVWEGKNVIATGRKIIGMTNPSDSPPGTIRGDFAIEMGRYIYIYIHTYPHKFMLLIFWMMKSMEMV